MISHETLRARIDAIVEALDHSHDPLALRCRHCHLTRAEMMAAGVEHFDHCPMAGLRKLAARYQRRLTHRMVAAMTPAERLHWNS